MCAECDFIFVALHCLPCRSKELRYDDALWGRCALIVIMVHSCWQFK